MVYISFLDILPFVSRINKVLFFMYFIVQYLMLKGSKNH